MPITVVQTAPSVNLASLTGPITATFASPTTAGNTLVACIGAQGSSVNPVVSAITIGGAADHWAAVVTQNATVSYSGTIWYDPGCTGGQTAVAVTFTSGVGTPPMLLLTVYEVSGILVPDKTASNVVASGATTWTSTATAATTVAAEIFFGTVMTGTLSPAQTGVGTWTTQAQNSTSWGQIAGFQIVAATGTATFSGTMTSGAYGADVATFSAAPAAIRRRPVQVSPRPRRARLGRLGLCAAGIASAIVTPPGAQQAHKPPVPVTRPAPHRAQAGPRGSAGAGNAGPQPAAVLVTTAYQRPSPQISRRLPQRAVWRGLASQVVTPRGSPSSPLPRPVIQHLPPQRARTGPAGRPAGGIASAAVTPLGSLQAPRRVVIAPPRHARAVTGHSQVAGGVAGPSATVPVGAQAYQRPPPQVRRPGPARARLGPAGSTGDGVTGPANAQPAAAVSPPRLPPQTRRPAPARGQWRGNASQIVTPLGTPARRPGPQITSRPRVRALWRGISGTIAPPVTALPKWRPLPSRRKPQRARTGGVLGLANALPPAFTVGSLTASGAPSAVLTAGGASNALTASTAPGSTLTAGTQSTGGPQ